MENNTHSLGKAYVDFLGEIEEYIPKERIHTDPMKRLAWGTDAGFYRLTPRIVIEVASEEEVVRLFGTASRRLLPVTFRAAGTSLSGQAISDSVLIVAGRHWEKYTIHNEGSEISMQPGLRGGRVNEILAPLGRKFSPDPASLKTAMVGGIVMNNASGMSCGTHANSDMTLKSARIILTDGTLLDTGNAFSRSRFEKRHPGFIKKIRAIRSRINDDLFLPELIRKKYQIKNVTGLNLLPFVRFEEPFDIIAHLMTGSEGTLAFFARGTFQTEPIKKLKASALVFFENIFEACKAVQQLRCIHPSAVELFDRKALHSVENQPNVSPLIREFGENVTALLIQAEDDSQEGLNRQIKAIETILGNYSVVAPFAFTSVKAEYEAWWALRSGIFPSVGGMREPGTSCLIEDVAFPMEVLPQATLDLQKLIADSGYHDGVIYGHALEGNFHFIINQRFDADEEVKRYRKLMENVVELVVDKYQGSLKAEHGTGRNMAPFVKKEWGEKAYGIMKEIKELFDPFNILNPGVIFNDDPDCFVKNLKPLPMVSQTVDKCIECGFCEPNCVTAGFTLSSRQRIVVAREMERLRQNGDEAEYLHELEKAYRYDGEQTCAGDGLCATSCPMKINTGELIHEFREKRNAHNTLNRIAGNWSARNLSVIRNGMKGILYAADTAHALLGPDVMGNMAKGIHRASFRKIPLWTPAMPQPLRLKQKNGEASSEKKVVYFPSCINQSMGGSRFERKKADEPLIAVMIRVLERAGYEVIFPKGMKNLCCGTIWESKGFPKEAEEKTKELERALFEASEQGKYPVICDQSPCLHRMQEHFTLLHPYDSVEFIARFAQEYLEFSQKNDSVALHITCSSRKMGLEKELYDLASKCVTEVFIPQEVGCCGFAGDKGFTHPEVNEYALRKLKPQLIAHGITNGYSNSRTCEIGLTTNTGVPYRSLVYLVDECTV
ncbi:MAG: FAD-binding and (Fe-S)-binding domain-containing protein [Bacteroidales bacterium]